MRNFLALPILLSLTLLLSCSKSGTNTSSAEIKDITPKKAHNLLIVESESCIYCKQLDRDIKRDQNLQKALVGVDVNKLLYEGNAKVRYRFGKEEGISQEHEVAKMLGVNSFPHLFFYDQEGKIILSIPGYIEPKTFVCVLDYVKENEYTKKKLQDYLKEKRCV